MCFQHRDAQRHRLGRSDGRHGGRGCPVYQVARLRPVQQADQAVVRVALAVQGAGDILTHGAGVVAPAFVDSACLVGEQHRIVELFPGGGDPAQSVAIEIVVPINGCGIQISFGLAGLLRRHAIPELPGAAEEFAVRQYVTHAGEDALVARVGLLPIAGQRDRDFSVSRIVGCQ